jgi:hypothetical protein
MAEKPLTPPPSPSGIIPLIITDELSAIITRSGPNALFVAQELFFGTICDEHTICSL